MFHGYFTGNVNVKNNATSNVNNTFVVDGGIKTPTGSMTQQGGRLFFQGHYPCCEHSDSRQQIKGAGR